MSVSVAKKIAMDLINFYRRPLPSICVSFSSDEGKSLFREAMISGHMENYFRVACQLRTQDEPSFCGLATLVMCLNALEVDPGRIWKGPWRWYHERMLDCCLPLESIKASGITLDQFVCIAKCNGLTTNVKKMSDPQDFEYFKNLLLRITKQDDEILVVSYSRKLVMQTGDGHFAPVGGFNKEKEMVLLFDTARFKYPPHWVPIKYLWEAMFAIDKETGKPRGYMTLSKDAESSCLLLLSTSVHLNEYFITRKGSDSFAKIIKAWDSWLNQKIEDNMTTSLILVKEAVENILDYYLGILDAGEKALFFLTCHNIFSKGMDSELELATTSIIKEIVGSKIGVEVNKVLKTLINDEIQHLSVNVFLVAKLEGCSLLFLQDSRTKLTFLITSWLLVNVPMQFKAAITDAGTTRCAVLNELALNVLQEELSLNSKVELNQLSEKMRKMKRCQDMLCCELSSTSSLCCDG